MNDLQKRYEPNEMTFDHPIGKLLAKHQPCGCVVCDCEDDHQCHGCGAKNCGNHPVGKIPNPVYVNTPPAERPTPITDAAAIALHGTRLAPGCIYVKAEDMRNIERQLAEARGKLASALRRESDQITLRKLNIKQLDEAREQRDRLAVLAGEMIAMIRVNVMRDTFREITIEQVDEHLKPWIERISEVERNKQ